MLKICTIGIGNAGNQIADLAMSKYQIPGIAINSSQKDLISVNNIPKIVIGDQKGAGKSREEAKRFIKMHIKDLLDQEKFINHIEASDIVFII
jgi:cell division GTPase FtsZ